MVSLTSLINYIIKKVHVVNPFQQNVRMTKHFRYNTIYVFPPIAYTCLYSYYMAVCKISKLLFTKFRSFGALYAYTIAMHTDIGLIVISRFSTIHKQIS